MLQNTTLPHIQQPLLDNTGLMDRVWYNSFDALFTRVNKRNSVLDYGAKGNGTTDDADAINNAIQASLELGGVVYFPSTDNGFAIGSPIVLPSNVVLIGDNTKGAVASRIKPISGYSGNLIESEGWNASEASATKIQQSAIIGLFLDGSGTTLTAIDIYGQECFISNCTIKNCFTYGIRIAGKSSDLGLNNNIQNCYLTKVGSNRFYTGIFEDYYTGDNKFFNNYIEGCNDCGIETRGANCQISDCHIYDTKYHILSRDTVERQFTDNYLEFCTHSAIRVENGSSSESQLFMIVANNIFRNTNTGGSATGVIELNGSNCNYAVIQGNMLRRDSGTTYSSAYFVWKSAAFTDIVLDSTNFVYVAACITTGLIN